MNDSMEEERGEGQRMGKGEKEGKKKKQGITLSRDRVSLG